MDRQPRCVREAVGGFFHKEYFSECRAVSALVLARIRMILSKHYNDLAVSTGRVDLSRHGRRVALRGRGNTDTYRATAAGWRCVGVGTRTRPPGARKIVDGRVGVGGTHQAVPTFTPRRGA
jgi:hypothetical protein